MAAIETVFPAKSSDRIRAAEYVRMSTEHQQYSIDNQRAKLREYAAAHGIEVVRAYEDGGKSGLTIRQRPALQQLLRDVESRQCGFSVVLVYDVSRWGRFQDADESAHHEYRCKRAGVRIIYCAEQFDNDGSPVASIVKGVKRVMAGEYSRELSVKVTAGQKRLASLGYRQGGGSRVYGYKSLLVDINGNIKGEIARGERKCVQNYHVVLGLGMDDEAAVVKQIFEWSANSSASDAAIARRLNESGKLRLGKPWRDDSVRSILTDETYIGTSVFGKTTSLLGARHSKNPPETWIRKENCHPALISTAIFRKVQKKIAARPKSYYPKDELLAVLRSTLAKHGRLSSAIIDDEPGSPSSSVYAKRFGSMVEAYRLIGYVPKRECAFTKVNRAIKKRFPELAADIGSRHRDRELTIEGMEAYSLEMARSYVSQIEEILRLKMATVST